MPTLPSRPVAAAVAALLAAVAALTWYAARPAAVPPAAPLATPQPGEELAEGLYFCGRTETLRDQLATAPWPDKRITWTVSPAGQSRLEPATVKEAFALAWASWAERIDIEPVYVPNEKDALVVSRFGQIDGSGKVLAWSELADGRRTQKHQLYDAGEQWSVHAGKAATTDLGRVSGHEIGHVLGLVHDEPVAHALMAPTYSQSIRGPTERDFERLLLLGYQRRSVAPRPPAPAGKVRIEFDAAVIADALKREGWTVQPPAPKP